MSTSFDLKCRLFTLAAKFTCAVQVVLKNVKFFNFVKKFTLLIWFLKSFPKTHLSWPSLTAIGGPSINKLRQQRCHLLINIFILIKKKLQLHYTHCIIKLYK